MHNTFEECLFIKVTYGQVMTNRMGNPEAERGGEFYNQHWTKEAVTRYFYTKVNNVLQCTNVMVCMSH